MKRMIRGAATLLLAALPLLASAQWPERPIKIVVPFPAGNSSDVSMRLLGERLSARLGQPVVIENRVGAGGALGAGLVAKAPPDGYTLGMGSTGPMAIAKALRPDTVTYDAPRDFAVVGGIAWAHQLLTVRKDFPASTFAEFVAHARKPGVRLNYATGGNGTTHHLIISQLVNQTRISAEHVPYKGSVEAITAVIGGQVDFALTDLPPIRGPLAAEQVRLLGTASGARIPSLPNVPTLREQGAKDFDYPTWILLIAPKGVPEPIMEKLYSAVEVVMKMPDLRDRLLELGLAPMDLPRARFSNFLYAEEAKWSALVQSSGAAASMR